MRQFTITQDLDTDVETHWKLFHDDAYNREQFAWMKYKSYEQIERHETDTELKRSLKVMPKLDLPGPVAKLFGDGFGYVEAGTFDKRTRTWKASTTPNMLKGKLRSEVVVRVEPNGDKRCRRICDITVEANVFAIGGLIESSLEKNMRAGWDGAAAFLNQKLGAKAAP